MKRHLAIFTGSVAQDILEGRKTIESRFSLKKIPPFGVIEVGDLVFIKPSGKKDVLGQFRVKKVISYEGLEVKDIEEISKRYEKEILADETFWQQHSEAKYGSLIFIGEVQSFLTSPVKFEKKDLRGWVVLD